MKHVAVLMGGWSAEREVSLRSGKACADALERTGALSRQPHRRRPATSPPPCARSSPIAALNVLHGRPGEDGTLQGLLEILGIPYTHSGVMASAVAMQKDIAKTVLKAANVPVPGGVVVSRAEAAKKHLLPPPYVIKPVAEGSSVGVFIVREDHKHPPQELTRADWTFGDRVLVEPYIPGKELTCAVMGDKALGVIEIVAATKFYDYEAKYAPGGSKHLLPAPVVARNLRGMPAACRWPRIARSAAAASRAPTSATTTACGPKGLACLEVNTQPGMTETSLVPELAAHAGIEFRGVGALDGRGRLARSVMRGQKRDGLHTPGLSYRPLAQIPKTLLIVYQKARRLGIGGVSRARPRRACECAATTTREHAIGHERNLVRARACGPFGA